MLEFSVGDLVRVRDWDDMAGEFGMDSSGNIDCEHTFVEDMSRFCGNVYRIESIYDSTVSFEDGVDGTHNFTWSFDMIELVEQAEDNSPEAPEISIEALNAVLGSN